MSSDPEGASARQFQDGNELTVMQMRVKDPLNRIRHPTPYICFYLTLWSLSIALALGTFPSAVRWQSHQPFDLALAIVCLGTLLEIYARALCTGSRFWSSWACIPELLVCMWTIITWSLSGMLPIGGGPAFLGICILLPRSMFQCLRAAFVALSVQNLRQQADIDSVDVDVDNFRLRGALRPVYPPSSLEEVLAYSFSCALEGILRVVQLVLSFAIFGYSGVNVLVVILLMFFIVIEIVVCFKDIAKIPVIITVFDVLAMVAVVVAFALEPWQFVYGLPVIDPGVAGFCAGWAPFIRNFVRLVYYPFAMRRSFSGLSAPAIRLPDDDEPVPENVDVAGGSESPV